MNSILEERGQLARERILQIPGEMQAPEPYRDFFIRTARFLQQVFGILDIKKSGQWAGMTLEERKDWNHVLYEDILPEHYQSSYGDPRYAQQMLGSDYGKELSCLYSQLRGSIVFAFEDRMWDLTVLCELFLEVYTEFLGEELPKPENIRNIMYSYIRDYCDDMMEYRVREMVDPDLDFAASIIMNSDLSDLRYLYEFGEYITDSQIKTAEFLNKMSREEIERMAKTYTEGYRIGFENNGIDLSKKKTVNIRYSLGFERIIRAAILQFEKMGLRPVIYRSATHLINRRQHLRIGYYGAIPNQQFDYDHRNDAAVYLTEEMVSRKLRALQNGFESCKELANTHAGPAVMETFGETPFVPEAKDCVFELSKKQQKMLVRLDTESSQITNRYIIGKERSFTIIAWPVPEIGEHFEEIFEETIKINTLDYKKYQKIQQCIIDALDLGQAVHIKGCNGNRTDLTVKLQDLEDGKIQTLFENCVADVNIPVGEVFTSPKLTDTNGILHVTRVFLNGLEYRDLSIHFRDGMIQAYSCQNFQSEEENKAYIRENILHQHESLPMGEFAIGTNTTAYVMAEKYQISDKLPILIAEKTGPHFAVGDTCYSWAEDTPVYNPDGKEVIARDNEVSIKRREDLSQAYFGCHTDITIPYDELESIRILTKDGEEIPVIEKGRFVLAGTQELNAPFSG